MKNPIISAMSLLLAIVFVIIQPSCTGDDNPVNPNPTNNPLKIISFSPERSMPGDTLRIFGTGFGSDANQVNVKLGNIPLKICEVMPTVIKCIVPESKVVIYEKIIVYTSEDTVESEKKFRLAFSPWKFYRAKISFRFEKIKYKYAYYDGGGGDGIHHSNSDTIPYEYNNDFVNKYQYGWYDTTSIGNKVNISSPISDGAIHFDGNIDSINKVLSNIYLEFFSYSNGETKSNLKANNIPYTINQNGTLTARIENSEIMKNVVVYHFRHDDDRYPGKYRYWEYGPVISTEKNSYIVIELFE